MNRAEFLNRIAEQKEPWDVVVIGGGATGLGIAVDAATRGYRVALFEQSDFGKGTSSRSTKLVHGGVRYLKQGKIGLVRESLKERERLRRNAPHLVHDLPFLVPSYGAWDKPFYGVGLKIYDLLAGRRSFGRSRILSRKAALQKIPTLRDENLRGGVEYHDGQFDDARLLIALARTAAAHGACLLNYAPVIAFAKTAERISGVRIRDAESGAEHEIAARVVINATGAFCDHLRSLDEPGCAPIISPSQGAHIVLHREFIPGNTALMVPKTRDGRVLFAIPWHGHVVVGTTDTPTPSVSEEPAAFASEIDFILETAAGYLAKAPGRADILSVFTGIRPLVRAENVRNTAALSRDHTIHFSPSGLLSITGGKWTTYRRMAEDAVNQAARRGGLGKSRCVTRDLRLHGWQEDPASPGALAAYGADVAGIQDLIRLQPALQRPLHPGLPIIAAQVVWAARCEMARTLDDVLARRTRALFLNQAAAIAMAPKVAELLAKELGQTSEWQQDQLAKFQEIAANFAPPQPTTTS